MKFTKLVAIALFTVVATVAGGATAWDFGGWGHGNHGWDGWNNWNGWHGNHGPHGHGKMVRGRVFEDANGNGRLDRGERGVARVPVSDGVHSVESENGVDGLSVIVVGWDNWDSYGYLGGMGMVSIND